MVFLTAEHGTVAVRAPKLRRPSPTPPRVPASLELRLLGSSTIREAVISEIALGAVRIDGRSSSDAGGNDLLVTVDGGVLVVSSP